MSEEVRTVSIPASKVFVDFGRRKVYAITSDGDEVLVFNSLEEMVEKLNPAVIVVDNLPGALQKTAVEIAKAGIAILRIKDLKIIAEERERNGVRKTDENDVRLLKTIFHRSPDLFQPLFTDPYELKVRALTEMWVFLTSQKRMSKYLRTTTNDEDVTEIHKTLIRLVDKVSKRIHEEALKLPLYRKAVEQLQLQGPALAYIVSHDSLSLKTLSRDKLEVRYALYKRQWRRRPLRSQLLIVLAWAAVKHGHPKYAKIYNEYRRRGKKHWQAFLRVTKVILKDLARIAKSRDAGLTEKNRAGVVLRPAPAIWRGLGRAPSSPVLKRQAGWLRQPSQTHPLFSLPLFLMITFYSF